MDVNATPRSGRSLSTAFRLLTLLLTTSGVAMLLSIPLPAQPPAPSPIQQPGVMPQIDDPVVQRGIDVQARGAVHEAFAAPTAEPTTSPLLAKKPPENIEEMPPAEKPEGDVAWIGGYWHWDEERNDYLWISGCWRTLPPGRRWMAGYWRDQGGQWQWVSGFWAAAEQPTAKTHDLTYYPAPPAPPQVRAAAAPPTADSFFMPGQYVWRDGRYVYVAGYWARVQPGYVWVASHYRWTPYGYVYVAGYWDYSLARRGLLYAPVTVDVAVVGPGFVYMPAYAISDTVMIDAFWVGPGYRHYYFGHYYGPVYRGYGYECCIVYSQRHYDGIVVYAAWDSHDPRWRENRVEIFIGRDNGRLGCPPRTLVEQRIAMRNGGVGVAVMVAPGRRIAADRGIRVVSLNREAQLREKARAEEIHRSVVRERMATESRNVGNPGAPCTAQMSVSPNHTAGPAAGPAHGPATPAHPAAKAGPTLPGGRSASPPPGQHPPDKDKDKDKGGPPKSGG